ncbi:tRNA uridine-5-carboxymethylaminomethyl(34) synthesis GTPase MnmE [Ureaplasma ceti]|uniref:tRNA modification GTPase MnmE n=1 Tax=Ureaplasma ceti TaxID=3119530 RepID=A0ABP9U7U6_9BACT
MFNLPTICAMATARMNCAIHIIRVSGYDAYDIVNKITNKPVQKKSFAIQRALIMDGDQIVDDVLINTFVAPKSYTGEDTLEINCHGGVVVADYIMQLLLKNGATMATRGEYTKRAMLNKKIDVSQVEAINNLVYANNRYSVKGSVNALTGKVSEELKQFQHSLFMLIGQIEVNIDYPEFDDVPEITPTKALETTKELLTKIDKLITNSKRFVPLNEGIKIVILGNPNAGKSSLLNELSQVDKAIVSDIEGTTRDIVESTINVDGITLKLFDTAGLRETEDYIEKVGIEKAQQAVDNADLILLLRPVNEKEKPFEEIYNPALAKRHLIVYTKADLDTNCHQADLQENEILISVKNHDLNNLLDKIKEIFQVKDFEASDMTVLQSTRQIGVLENVRLSLVNAIDNLSNNVPLDLIVYDFEQANLKLNEILGNGNEYDFLDELFANFCVGK